MARQQGGAARDRLGVAVDRIESAGGGVENRLRIAAAAERAVEIGGAVARREGGEDFAEHHGDVSVHATPSARLSAFAASRASASRRSAAAGSQI